MGTHPIFESDFDCLTDFLIKNFQLGLKLNRWMIVLRVAPQCLRTLRRTSNYYLYLGVRYNAPTSEISNAIDAKKSEIKRRIGAEEEGASDEFGELDLRRTLGFLKRMEKTLLDDERRKKYNFEQRATLAETIPDLNAETKQLDAGDVSGLAGQESKVFDRHADDNAILEELNRDREIYVYNNTKEVVTHTNYTYEELAAMAQDSTEDTIEEEEKKWRKRRAMLISATVGAVVYYYFCPPELCVFRRARLTWADKKIIIFSADAEYKKTTGAEFVPPDFIPPEEFVPEGSEQLLPETFDVADLKAHLFDERVKNQKIKWLPWDLVFRSKDSHSTLAIPEEQEFKRVSK